MNDNVEMFGELCGATFGRFMNGFVWGLGCGLGIVVIFWVVK